MLRQVLLYLDFVAKSSQVTAITAGKGTLKRKQQIRELIEQQNEGYEDDLFESTPYRKQGSIKVSC